MRLPLLILVLAGIAWYTAEAQGRRTQAPAAGLLVCAAVVALLRHSPGIRRWDD